MDELQAMGFSTEQIEVVRARLGPTAPVENVIEALLSTGGEELPPLPLAGDLSVPPPTPASTTTVSTLQGNKLCLPISQYDFGDSGRSACTAISIAAVIQLLKKGDEKEVTSVLMESIQEGVTAATSLAVNTSTSVEHLNVDEVWPHIHCWQILPFLKL